jgi:hypothetical protein
MPQEGHANFGPMMEALHALFREQQEDGRVRVEYATNLYAGQLPGERK